MKLNLGAGPWRTEGWVNVDVNENHEVHPDVVASLLALPFPAASADAVYAGHILEHLPLPAVPDALAEVCRVLRPGGRLMVVGPDCDRGDYLLAAGELDADTFEAMHVGAQRWDGDRHHWDCTEALLIALLSPTFAAVLPVPIADVPDSWPVVSRAPWQCAVGATRP